MTEQKTLLQPFKPDAYEITRFNALRHGVLSRYTVLPWEDVDEYSALVEALTTEHAPEGPRKSILSKSWQGSCGASVASGWQRLLRTDAGLSASCRLIRRR
jgi:hypothetical protein